MLCLTGPDAKAGWFNQSGGAQATKAAATSKGRDAGAHGKQHATTAGYSGIHIVGAQPDANEVAELLTAVRDLLAASNRHDMDSVLKHYSPRFVSGDNLSLDQVQKLISETWKIYPDIRYHSQVMALRIHGDWATVESMDGAQATAKAEKMVGQLRSQSRGMLFFHRIGKTWEICSDYTLYESAAILFGEARKLPMALSTPDQVFAGEPYTAKISVQLPPGVIGIAAIAKEPLVYPQRHSEDKFRTVSDEAPLLERVFDANQMNRNEMVTATLGLTQITQDASERPRVTFNGLATLVKRVNVQPKSLLLSADAALPEATANVPAGLRAAAEEDALVRWSASGRIRFDAPATPGSSSPGNKLAPASVSPPALAPDEAVPPAKNTSPSSPATP
jgi:hypothetical protein